MVESHRTCASCGTSNEEDARFCEGCGATLARTCATCGVEARATARFCRSCGAPLDDGALDVSVAGPVRKTVTVMFADLAGSTTFEERVDAETAREVIGRYHDLLRSTAEHHRAGVTKYIGDGFMAVWGIPEVGADDAVRAVDAAVELQERFVGFAAQVTGVDLALRVSVNTGEVVVGAGDADLVGDALNVGARLESECPRGRVVVGEETWRATRTRYRYESLGEVQVKGRTAAVAVYQWVARRSDSTDVAPFVGRGDEVRRLHAAMDDAVSARAARLVTVIGDPGVGKSRLAAEFTKAQPGARVIDARCVLDATVALGPLVEVLRGTDLENDIPAGVLERDRLLRDLNGLVDGVPGSVEENFWALRRYVEVLASNGPVALVLDDIQWADTLLLDFIEHLVEWVKDVPILVLTLARPELRDIRPELVTVSRWASEAIHLGGLGDDATAELAANVLGATRLPDELLTRLPSSTGGNPLFVRELIGMLAHDGVLVADANRWRLTIDVDAITIPPTIHALLASRLERLDPADRRVLEIASVVGSDFSLGPVRALADTGADGIKLSLKRLRRLELAQPSGTYVGDEPVWRFHHVLIRDVAYRRLLKSDRANLHERLADWVAAGGQSVAFDADEMIARHLEAAYTYRNELGNADEHAGDLALRSARHYAASARRALDRDELVSAGTQAARGAAVAAADEALHAELLLIGCEAYLSAGDVAAGAPLVDDLDRIADDSLAPWATCYRCQFVVYTEPERLPEVDSRLQGAIDEFSRRKDPAGLAKAHRVRASARSRLGRIGDCEADLFEALIAARQSGDHRQITAALGAAPGAALWGPSPVPKAGGRCLDVVRMQRMTIAAPSLEATSLRHLAVLELLRGRPDKARKMLADARQVVADLGLRHGLMETELFAGIIESMEGDPVAAEPHFRTALEGLDALGVGADAGLAAAFLARSVLAQGSTDEADTYATESERLAGRNLKTAIAWRAVRAEILAAQGRYDEAVTLARDAVAVAAETDLVLDHADACLALRRVLEAAGDIQGANGARSNAEALYTAKEAAARISPVAQPAAHPTPASPALKPSRLAVTNRATETVDAAWRAFQTRDIDSALAGFSDDIEYDDGRRFSGFPVKDLGELRVATERAREQFPFSDWSTLAVRGERLDLRSIRMWDNDGNEATTLNVFEIGHHGRVEYWARFDEDDFEAAYRELDRRYYTGEGAAFAEGAYASTESIVGLNRGDYDRVFGELCTPEMRIENRSRSAFPDRSVSDLRTSWGALDLMTSLSRTWQSAVCWISPRWSISRLVREAVGNDGEQYTWEFVLVAEVRDGRVASMCQFDLADEDAAFTYAEERDRATTTRLGITNRASKTSDALGRASNASDVDAAVACYADEFVFDDRRGLSGDLINGTVELRVATERLFTDYKNFNWRTLAVRGERLVLNWSNSSDDDGNASAHLHVREIDDEGRFVYDGRFDEDDFEGAYRELERRDYAGEGAAFADAAYASTQAIVAINNGDYNRLFNDLITPDLGIENRTRSPFPDRSADDLRASFGELNSMIATSRSWLSVVHWLSARSFVSRLDRDAVGEDGERYTWTQLLVIDVRNGRLASICQFEPDDEQAAFAYAAEQMRSTTSWFVVANPASAAGDALGRALNAADVDAAMAVFSDRLEYDDRRRLSGNAVADVSVYRAAVALLVTQYDRLAWRTLAVRGDRLTLMSTRLCSDAGFEAAYLHVYEVNDDGLMVYEGRFDEDDFESAYRELEARYYAGEGADSAEPGATSTEWALALNRADFDTMFGELTAQDLRVENRSRSAFPDRSAFEYRATLEELTTRLAAVRTWVSAIHWVSQNWCVARGERDGIGEDGEHYSWQFLIAFEFRAGRVASMCEFEIDDEEGALAYAEERMQKVGNKLAVANAASAVTDAVLRALKAHDSDAHVAQYAELFTYDDRRRLAGDPIKDVAAMRKAGERIFQQYSAFEFDTLAVRGERLVMTRSRWSDVSGNETTYLHVTEIDETRRVVYDGRFDEVDFEGAYRELDRRYYAGEGAASAESGLPASEIPHAMSNDDFDRLFNVLCSPGLVVETRSGRAFPDRSAGELRLGFEELNTLVASKRIWTSAIAWPSPTSSIVRLEREAVGPDGQKFQWAMLLAAEHADGRVIDICEFDLDDEEGAFAYAEERMATHTSRLVVSNQASGIINPYVDAMRANDIDGAITYYSEHFEYDDHRRLSGDAVVGRDAMRDGVARVLAQYTTLEVRVLAVRGQRLLLAWNRALDDDGNTTDTLHLFETDDDARIAYHGRFDEDDFEGAYRALERRYYADEGSEFAEAGSLATEYTMSANQGNFDRVFGDLSTTDLHVDNRSRSGFPDRSLAEFRVSMNELNDMFASVRTWSSVICWLSPTSCVSRLEREAIDYDGARYCWTKAVASEITDGRLASMCAFELEDEDAAFAYAEERTRANRSRIAVTNRSVESAEKLGRALNAHDLDAIMECFSDHLVYDDCRRLTGDPISGRAEFRAAFERILAQYSHFERRILAVRGEHLNLHWGRWTDDSGNETAYLHVYEMDDDGRQVYEGRFDEDNFEDAYRKLEKRYAAGEGAAFAKSVALSVDWLSAMNRGEFDRMLSELSLPDVRFESRSRTAFPERTAASLIASLRELDTMFTSVRTWNSVTHWLSPNVSVVRMHREAVEPDGEQFEWARLYVTEYRHGRLASLCEFELEHENAAFAYAEERVTASTSQLAVTNRSSEAVEAMVSALVAHDVDRAFVSVSDGYIYDDRRRLNGGEIRGSTELRAAVARINEQYNRFDWKALAVRGAHLSLFHSRWSDDAGNETVHLHVFELDGDGLIGYEGRFDEDDFEGAYRELDRRYYAGEGAAFAKNGTLVTDYLMAYNHRDFDEFLGYLTNPDMRFENRSRSVFPDRSVAEFRTSIDALSEMVESTLAWYSSLVWLSPNFCVSRFERLSIGQDGEQYTWTRIYVSEFQDGQATLSCQFNVEDEAAAFAYAEEQMRASSSRLAVVNRSCNVVAAVVGAASAHDVDAIITHYSELFEYGDHRRLIGRPVHGRFELRAAFERILQQYTRSEWHALAVRGNNLSLHWSRWADDSGNETSYLHVFEIGDDGLILYEGRFDEDDFQGAYRELERRYYEGEGAAFARWGVVATESVMALNQRDYDRMFGELSSPELRLENRSRSVFPDRSIAEFRSSIEELDSMISSARTWFSCVRWLSPTWSVVRQQREALGLDGERFAWTRIYAAEIRDGRIASLCQFDIEDEDAAFAYAEERMRASTSCLTVTNRSCESVQKLAKAMCAHDIDKLHELVSGDYLYIDHRRLSGEPIRGRRELDAALERLFQQYNHFDFRSLAVRGDRLSLHKGSWSDDAGNLSAYLHVFEIGDDGRPFFEGRFDEEDFDGAYRELDQRYYAGEGAAYAEAGTVGTRWVTTLNRGEVDRAFSEFYAPDMPFENRSRAAFPDPSVSDPRTSYGDLSAIVASMRMWPSVICWVTGSCAVVRLEREAIGRDGELYRWTWVNVTDIRDGQFVWACMFDLEDEAAAFAYAEERVRHNEQR